MFIIKKNEKNPDIQFVRDWNSYSWDMRPNKDPKHVEWAKVLDSYGLVQFDEFDNAICKVMERGYIEETGLLDEAAKLDAQFNADELRNEFRAAWGLFHNTFVDNTVELIRSWEESFKRCVRHISPSDLNALVQCLRKLDNDGLADKLIELYITTRGNEGNLFNLDEYSICGGMIEDPKIRERFREQYALKQQIPTLLEVAKAQVHKNGWSSTELQVLKQATENDFYNLFKIEHGVELKNIIYACQRFQEFKEPEYLAIGENVRKALERIGCETPLNALRVKKYGINVEGSTLAGGKEA